MIIKNGGGRQKSKLKKIILVLFITYYLFNTAFFDLVFAATTFEFYGHWDKGPSSVASNGQYLFSDYVNDYIILNFNKTSAGNVTIGYIAFSGFGKFDIYMDNNYIATVDTNSGSLERKTYNISTQAGSHILKIVHKTSGRVGIDDIAFDSTLYQVENYFSSNQTVDTTPPANVSNFNALYNTTNNYVILSWSANTETDLKGYEIFRDGVKIADLGPTVTNFFDYNISLNNTYTYGIRAYDTSYNLSSMVTVQVTTTRDIIPPASVINFTGYYDEINNKIVLNWSPNTDPDLAGYEIFRDGIKIADLGASATSYTDQNINFSSTYSYSIRAYDTTYNVSDFNTIIVSTPEPHITAPTLDYALLSPTTVQLSWNKIDGVDGYILYKDNIEIARIPAEQTSYLDNSLQVGNTYIFGIKAYKSQFLSDISEVQIKIDDPTPRLTYSVRGDKIYLYWTGYADLYKVYVNDNEISTVATKQYVFQGEQEKSYKFKVMAIFSYDNLTYTSNEVNVYIPKVSQAVKMIEDVFSNIGYAIYPLGSLLALGLALKASPTLIEIARTFIERRF